MMSNEAAQPQIGLSLALADGTIELTPAQARAVSEQFPEITREARRWRAKLGQSGSLIVIDPDLVAAVRAYLAGQVPPTGR
jgi:hypothetical protein